MPRSDSPVQPDGAPFLLRALLAGEVAAPGGVEADMAEIRSAQPSVAWFGVNERRVDALVDAGSDPYRIVYFTDDAATLESVSVFRRPPPLEPIIGGQVVVVNGPSGVGKSSVLAALEHASARRWVLFDEPVMGVVDQPYLIWRDRAPHLHRGFFEAMAALARRGSRVALSAAGHPASLIDEAFAGIPTLRVGLDCDVDTLLERERGREGRWGGLAVASLNVHEAWQYDTRFDTASVTPETIAAEILRQTR